MLMMDLFCKNGRSIWGGLNNGKKSIGKITNI